MRRTGFVLLSLWWFSVGKAWGASVGVHAFGNDRTERMAITQVSAGVQERLRQMGWNVVADALERRHSRLLERTRRCIGGSESCEPEPLEALGVDRLVLVRVEDSSDGEKEPTLILFDGTSGRVLVNEQYYCERCTEERASAAGAALVTNLIRAAEARMGAARLAIRTRPEGAEVALDGHVIGVSNITYGVYPGSHRIQIRKSGYRMVERNVMALEQQTTIVEVDLVREAHRPFRRWKWVALGAGAALTATGVTLILLHQPEIEDGAFQPEARETLVPGIATTVAGIGVLGAGFWFWRADATASEKVTVGWNATRGSFALLAKGVF